MNLEIFKNYDIQILYSLILTRCTHRAGALTHRVCVVGVVFAAAPEEDPKEEKTGAERENELR